MDALEKEISIDIAELRRDLRSWKNDLYEHLSLSAKKISEEDPENAEEKGIAFICGCYFFEAFGKSWLSF